MLGIHQVHGNICCLSVVVTPMLDWKLHAFDITTEVGKVEEESTLRVGHEAVAEQYKPEELRQGDMSTIAQSPPWAVDAWGLGCFWQELFSGQPLREMGQLRNVDSLPKPVRLPLSLSLFTAAAAAAAA
jgi:SCY1-like protein 1